MADEKSYKISVGTADEYEDYIAEIHFPGKAGVIVSQEKGSGEFELSIHSFNSSSGDNFDYCRNIDEAKIPLSELNEALEKAVNELKRLKQA